MNSKRQILRFFIFFLTFIAITASLYVYIGGNLNTINGISDFFWFFKIILITGSIPILLYFLLMLPRYIRKLRMRSIATKYNLNFERKSFLFESPDPDSNEKLHRIFGKIKGHDIEIYDYISYFNPFITYGYLSKYYTMYSKDGVSVSERGVAEGFRSIHEIKEWIESI